MRVGVLTGGGDCPGLNAVIRAAVRKGDSAYGHEFIGYRNGWRGVIDGEASALDFESTRGILPRGGTILGTSRTNPYKRDDGLEQVRAGMDAHQVEALIAIGGEDTLGVASRLHDDGVKVVGVPKTIDNDLSGTDRTFGFETAVQIATEAIDRLHTTAESHDRVLIVEVMGRHAGWIALNSGIAGGADVILIPELEFAVDDVCTKLRRRVERGRNFSIIVVAEGAKPEGGIELSGGETDEFGHAQLAGIGSWLEHELGERTGYECRTTVLGHVQRGGTPTAYDRVLATRFGLAAADAVEQGNWGTMSALRGTAIEQIPLADAVTEPKVVDPGYAAELGALLLA